MIPYHSRENWGGGGGGEQSHDRFLYCVIHQLLHSDFNASSQYNTGLISKSAECHFPDITVIAVCLVLTLHFLPPPPPPPRPLPFISECCNILTSDEMYATRCQVLCKMLTSVVHAKYSAFRRAVSISDRHSGRGLLRQCTDFIMCVKKSVLVGYSAERRLCFGCKHHDIVWHLCFPLYPCLPAWRGEQATAES